MDSPEAHSIVNVAYARVRGPRLSRSGDQRLAALRVTDRPRLVGWSSP
jgi:hypothetical protein